MDGRPFVTLLDIYMSSIDNNIVKHKRPLFYQRFDDSIINEE